MINNPEDKIIHRELDMDAKKPGLQVAKTVAEIEGDKATDLTSMHECVDGVLGNLFSEPPSLGAQMQANFSYEGYRITIEQNGETE